jgi:dipeptidase E
VRGLGLLPYSNCVHYDAEPERREQYRRLVAEGMRPGFAAEDGVGLHFRGTRLQRAVSSRPGARAYRVEPGADGVACETPLQVDYLGESAGAGQSPGAADGAITAHGPKAVAAEGPTTGQPATRAAA